MNVINGARIISMTVRDFKQSNRENWLKLRRGTTKKKREGSLKIKWWDCENESQQFFKREMSKFNDSLTIKKRLGNEKKVQGTV